MTASVTRNLSLLSAAPDGIKALRQLVRDLAVGGRLLPDLNADAWPVVQLADLVQSFQNGVSSRGISDGISVVVLRLADIKNGSVSLEDPRQLTLDEGSIEKYRLVIGDVLVIRVNGSADLVGRFVVCESSVGLPCDHFIRLRLDQTRIGAGYLKLVGDCPATRTKIQDLFVSTAGQKTVNQTHIGSLSFALPPLADQHRIVAKVDELMALCDRLEARQQDAEAAHDRLVQALLDSLTQARDADEFQACWQRLADQLESVFTTEASIDYLERAVLELAITGRMTRAGSKGNVGSDLATVQQERARSLTQAKLKKHDSDAAEVYWACPYELPERWAWVSLAALVLQITDGTHHTPTYVDEGTPFISVKDLDGKTVSFEDCRHIPHAEYVAINERCNPERGDILICRIGTLGRPTIVDTDRAFSLFVSVGLLKMPKSIKLAEYIHLVLRSPLAYRQYDRIKAGGSHTNKLNLGDIPKIMVPLPPAEERAEILAVVREVLGLCGLLRSRIAAARAKHTQLAQALVEQAVA